MIFSLSDPFGSGRVAGSISRSYHLQTIRLDGICEAPVAYTRVIYGNRADSLLLCDRQDLEEHGNLIAVSAGDTVRWVVGNTTSGSGNNSRVHILVKPFAPGLETNMVTSTDRRTYHLALESTETTAMTALFWTYPEDQLIALRAQNKRADATAPVASGLALENLQFRYEITGDKASATQPNDESEEA